MSEAKAAKNLAPAEVKRGRGRPKGSLSRPEQNVAITLAKRGMKIAQIARLMNRDARTVSRLLQDARSMLDGGAEFYVEQFNTAVAIAALKGDARPAQWALEKIKVVEPTEAEANRGPVIQIGISIPGLAPVQEPSRLAITDGEIAKPEDNQ